MATEILRKKLPPNMRSDFWNDFIDCIEVESELVKTYISDIKTYYDFDSMDYDRMIEFAIMLGIPLDVSYSSDTSFIRKELQAIPFKVQYKNSTTLYLSLFKALSYTGLIYLYYYNGTKLIRDTYSLLAYTNGIDPSEPYYHRSKMNFSTALATTTNLDEGATLDEGWYLDSESTLVNTNHIALEFFINTVITDSDTDYLTIPSLFSFINTNMIAYRKATEVDHIGCQLGVLADSSHYYDSYGLEYTMPDLQLKAITTDSFDDITDSGEFTYIVFGVGSHTDLPSTDGSGSQPTSLSSKVAKIEIETVENYSNGTWWGSNAEYQANMVNDEVIGTGDGATTSFSSTLAYYPIKKNFVSITFTADDEEYTLSDDGYGILSGTKGDGTIDYDTGDITVSTDIYYPESEVAGTGDGSTTSFSYTTTYSSLGTETISITYIISGTTYVATDDGDGVITGTSLSGTVTYTSGVFALTFDTAPADTTSITLDYSYEIVTYPDDATEIITEYYFSDSSLQITEAGLLDSDENLLAYATFPPIYFKNYSNHLNLFFMTHLDTYNISVGDTPLLCCSSDSYVWITNSVDDTISKISISDNTVESTITVGTTPTGCCYDDTNSYIWIVNAGDNTVSNLGISDSAISDTVTVGTLPYACCLGNSYIWVTNTTDGTVSKIDISDNTVESTITVGTSPKGCCSNDTYVWVCNSDDDTVSKINISTDTVDSTITVGTNPTGIYCDDTYVWVTNYDDGTVSKITASTDTVGSTITVGTGPIDCYSNNTYVWITNYNDNTVSKITISDDTIYATLNVGTNPYGCCSDDSTIRIVNSGDNTIQKLVI